MPFSLTYLTVTELLLFLAEVHQIPDDMPAGEAEDREQAG